MSVSNDPGHFFQSAAALENAARKAEKAKNQDGDIIKLPSKILAVINDPGSSEDTPAVLVAEAAGLVKCIDLRSKKVARVFRPSSNALAPLTCLAIAPSLLNSDQTTLFAGCWDKGIYRWTYPTTTRSSAGTTSPLASDKTLVGHTDFVKALLCFHTNGEDLLVSSGADSFLIVWNAKTGQRLHTLKGHSRGVQALAQDPFSRLAPASESGGVIYSGDSNQEIRAWSISADRATEIQIPLSKEKSRALVAPSTRQLSNSSSAIDPFVIHETSIYTLRFSAETGDLWTASADKTAKGLSFDSENQRKIEETTWQEDTTLLHPDYVRDVAIDDANGFVVTACRDEGVRVWDSSSGDLIHCYEGHFEEVTSLAIVSGAALEGGSARGRAVVSVSIDNTARVWSLDPSKLKEAREESIRRMESGSTVKTEVIEKPSILTEEEERELAELMDSDDD